MYVSNNREMQLLRHAGEEFPVSGLCEIKVNRKVYIDPLSLNLDYPGMKR